MTVREGELLWTPSPEFVRNTALYRYMHWLADCGVTHADYESLRRWSVARPDDFWKTVWTYFDVVSDGAFTAVRSSDPMPRTRWFPGARLNFAEHVLRTESRRPDRTAIVHRSELRAMESMTWSDLGDAVRAVATALRERGIGPGDRVACYMPNIAETAIAMLATTAIGAVWTSAAPEFGAGFVVDRFAQIEPAALFVCDGYRFGGRDYDRSADVRAIVSRLPSLRLVITLPYLDPAATFAGVDVPRTTWDAMARTAADGPRTFAYERVGTDHPLWILFTSGTTGLPKAIVHSHVGIVLESYKNLAFHADIGPESTMFFYTTTGWMMWNALLASLLHGGSVVLYDGHPAHPSPDFLWRLAVESGTTSMGASPTFVKQMHAAGIVPAEVGDLSRLAAIVLSGSPCAPETFAWFYERVKPDLWVTSQSGGTEFCSGLVGGVPILPVYAAEIQARGLGMDVEVWDEAGHPVIDQVGELMVAAPCPSMPIALWNDADGKRYREAYFDPYPNAWRHGDFALINGRGGCYVYGRSDATLNRYGVRIGSAEIYRALEDLPEVLDALVVCLELPDGGFYMPLFVKLAGNAALTGELRSRINEQLRTRCSPRHVPDEIRAVPAIPHTITGKKMEIPVRRILAGADVRDVADPQSLADPAALQWFVDFAASHPHASAIASRRP